MLLIRLQRQYLNQQRLTALASICSSFTATVWWPKNTPSDAPPLCLSACLPACSYFKPPLCISLQACKGPSINYVVLKSAIFKPLPFVIFTGVMGFIKRSTKKNPSFMDGPISLWELVEPAFLLLSSIIYVLTTNFPTNFFNIFEWFIFQNYTCCLIFVFKSFERTSFWKFSRYTARFSCMLCILLIGIMQISWCTIRLFLLCIYII